MSREEVYLACLNGLLVLAVVAFLVGLLCTVIDERSNHKECDRRGGVWVDPACYTHSAVIEL